MSNIGSGWTQLSATGKTIISIQIDDVLREMFPQLKNIRFGLSQILQSERESEKSPHWRVYAYVPQEDNTKKIDKVNQAIAAEAQNLTENEMNARLAEAAEMQG